jgi:hypothetical protein
MATCSGLFGYALDSGGRTALFPHRLRKGVAWARNKSAALPRRHLQEHSIGRAVSVNSSIGLADAANTAVLRANDSFRRWFPPSTITRERHGVAEKAYFAGFFTDHVGIHSPGLLRASHAIL